MQAVAALVRNTTCLADVGCDHGYVPIYLIQSECIGHAIAMNVNRGPLLRAEEHGSRYTTVRQVRYKWQVVILPTTRIIPRSI